jgi:serine carboxypeptidase 1
MYLQGGPGDSSTGFGNFMEIGRRDLDLSVRNNSWDNHANILFVDNPVGVGFSQVFNNAFSLNNTQIAKDLLALFKKFLVKNPEFETSPFYVFTESYGGKMAAGFGVLLFEAIQTKEIQCNFRGIHMGDAAVSLEDSLASWPQYLHVTGMIDEDQKNYLESDYVIPVRRAIAEREGALAMDLWIEMREKIAAMTSRLNMWNILEDKVPWRHDKELIDLMNGPVKQYLNISDNVTWGEQGSPVFEKLRPDFMYPVTEEVEYLLNNSQVKIAVVSGQLDVVCSHLGAEWWSHRLNWPGSQGFRAAKREGFIGTSPSVKGYVKKFGQLSLYIIRDAGHSVPQDQLDVSVHLLQDITRE